MLSTFVKVAKDLDAVTAIAKAGYSDHFDALPVKT
jgi:hypothetical protein